MGRSPPAPTPASSALLLLLLVAPHPSFGFSPPARLVPPPTRLHSLPTPIDTLTSGLASIARLPRGVTVSGGVSTSGPAASFLPTLKALYDVENDRECRSVRERITELDLIVERVVPSAPNSRAVAAAARSGATLEVPTLVAEVDGEEATLGGSVAILDFLEEHFTTEAGGEEVGGDGVVDDDALPPPDGDLPAVLTSLARDVREGLGRYLPGALRYGRGSRVCGPALASLSPPRPEKPPVLYSYEGNQFCRLVREVLTELDVEYELRSAGKGSPRREELAALSGGSSQCPYLIDPNTGRSMAESRDIVEYLYSTYALWTPPSELLRGASDVVTPLLAPLYGVLAPLQAGSYREDELEYKSDVAEAKAEVYEEISASPVVVYTYSLSPFCTEAISILKSLKIDYKEISLGKEWIPGLIDAPAKRAALLEITGQSSLPHVFVGGTSVGGLYSGTPGLVPSLEGGEFVGMVEEAR